VLFSLQVECAAVTKKNKLEGVFKGIRVAAKADCCPEQSGDFIAPYDIADTGDESKWFLDVQRQYS